MTLKIREEYKKHQKASETLISEAAVKWVEENVFLINEKLTYKQIEALQNKFIKFDDVFGKVKDKLPALAQLIGSAEDELNAVTAGRSSEVSADDMLKRMGYIYNTLSIFFSKDMKALLNAPMLRGAKENPDVKLNVLQAPKHDPSMIRDAFVDRLNPSKNQIKLLNKIYRGNLPQLDTTAIATQMLNLSYNELVELTRVGKVPMVTTSDLTTAAPAAPSMPPAVGTAPGMPAPVEPVLEMQMAGEPVKKNINAPIQSVVAPQIMKPMGSWGVRQQNHGLKENVDFLTEIMDAGKLSKLVNSINNIKSVAKIQGFEQLNGPMNQLIGKAKDELANNTFTEGKAIKQLIMFYNVLERIRDQWPQIKTLFDDETFDDVEADKLKAILNKSAKDPFFSGLMKKMLIGHYPGLEPARISNEIVAAAQTEGGIEAITDFFNLIQSLPQATKDGETAGTSSGATSNTGTGNIASPTDKAATTGAGNQVAPDQTVVLQNALNLNPKQAKRYLDALDKAGFAITKKA